MKTKPWAVLISDVHYNINTIDLADNVVKQAIAKAKELGVPLIIAGDLHDTKAIVRGECIKTMVRTFTNPGVRVIVIPGNHCMLNEKSTEHSLEFLRPFVDLYDSPTYDKSLNLWFIPYQSDTQKMKNFLSSIPQGSTIIAHQGIQTAFMGHYVQDNTSLPKEEYANYRVISGHYHRRQDIKCGRPRKGGVGLFSYIGNPYSLSFGEAEDGEKGFQVLYSDGTLQFQPTNLRRHIVMDLDIQDLWTKVEASQDDLVWIKVRGNKEQLNSLNKKEFGMKLLGHTNYKLDKVYKDTPKAMEKDISDKEILDSLIDNTNESQDQKNLLKNLWRELVQWVE